MSDLIRSLAKMVSVQPPVAPKRYDPKGAVIVAGHESPHKFDQFSLDHMGKGEGAQSFSKGLYFWEDPGVGRHYHNKFKQAGWDQDTFFKPPNNEIQNYHEDGIWADELKSLEALHRYGQLPLEVIQYRDSGKIKAAGAELERWAQQRLIERYGDERKARAWVGPPYGSTTDPKLGARFPGMPSIKEHQSLLREDGALALLSGWLNDEYNIFRADDFINPPGGVPGTPAFTYHTQIHADRRDLPDLRAPAGALPGHLQEPVRRAMRSLLQQLEAPPQGEDAYRHMKALANRTTLGGVSPGLYTKSGGDHASIEQFTDLADTDAKIASHMGRKPLLQPSGNHHPALGALESALMDEGVPGVRYAASGGRSPKENFVIYDPKYLEIVKRYPYSVAGPLLAPALTEPSETDRR
jgi:hypothetical protein